MMAIGCERWVSLEEVWTEGDKGQPLPQSLFSMLLCPRLSSEEKGLKFT